MNYNSEITFINLIIFFHLSNLFFFWFLEKIRRKKNSSKIFTSFAPNITFYMYNTIAWMVVVNFFHENFFDVFNVMNIDKNRETCNLSHPTTFKLPFLISPASVYLFGNKAKAIPIPLPCHMGFIKLAIRLFVYKWLCHQDLLAKSFSCEHSFRWFRVFRHKVCFVGWCKLSVTWKFFDVNWKQYIEQ